MTADQIHGALIIAAYVVGTLLAIGLASLLLRAVDRRSHEVDAAIAEDTRLIEHERQLWRAGTAKRNREAAERRMRGAS